jgi:hypothetical protein
MYRSVSYALAVLLGISTLSADGEEAAHRESLGEVAGRIHAEGSAAYDASPFSALSKDYFSRFSHDPAAAPTEKEILVDSSWKIVLPKEPSFLASFMAENLAEFLKRVMGVEVPIVQGDGGASSNALQLEEQGGGDPSVEESFTVTVETNRVIVSGRDPQGLRDGIVRLVDQMGDREAAILPIGSQVYRPRIDVRLGAIPSGGSKRDLIFLGYNSIFVGGGSLYALSESNAIPELVERRTPGALEALAKQVEEVERYGLKAYCFIDIRQKFPKDDPIFTAHPEIRGSLTWKADGEYTLCTEHPLVRRFLTESVRGIFNHAPSLRGITLIVGGEGFYHCFMRPFGVEKGHTNCERCEKLDGETVVANLCNSLAEAARSVNPNAEVIAWPYSAHIWSRDRNQVGIIEKLKPGTAILTEIEKDEYVDKPGGVHKLLWDYSMDLIGPGPRAKAQIEACKKQGIRIYLKSEPELAFEAPRLAHIPCMDRWVDRAEALASCGASGAWIFPAFRPCYGSSSAESGKLVWWDPSPDKEKSINRLASRIAGPEGGPHLREAWRHVSNAIPLVPEIPPYYTGPYYLGPGQPMCADPAAKLPEMFDGYYFFMAEITDAEGLKKRPIYFTSPRGDAIVFGDYYRKMETELALAVSEIDAAKPLVPPRKRLPFSSEETQTRWFYHTARTEANFYESCIIRDRVMELAKQPARSATETAEAGELLSRWRDVLLDEKANSEAALPVMEADVRLNFRYGGDHSFGDGPAVIRAKLEILDGEINEFLPSLHSAVLTPSP